MKIRQGFVSNSSSSSYVIMVKTMKPCEHCGRKDLNFLNLLRQIENYTSDSQIEIDSRAEVIEYLQDELNANIERSKKYYAKRNKIFDESRYAGDQEEIAKIMATPEDAEVAYINISHHDETLRAILDNAVENGTIEILSGDS